jgi:hypothetical protein
MSAPVKVQASEDADAGLKPAEKKMLYSALTNLKGKINFEQVAKENGVVNAEAA